MLIFPSKGAKKSPPIHILCDWIEASAVLCGETISRFDVRDILMEEQIFDDESEADVCIDNAWVVLKARQSRLKDGPEIEFKNAHLSARQVWSKTPEYAYCLSVSYAFWHSPCVETLGSDYTEQGEIFEDITKDALLNIFPDWDIFPTGWARARSNKIATVVTGVADFLEDSPYPDAIGKWVSEDGNDAGLDLVLTRKFSGKRAYAPVYFIQCASGGNWLPKTHDPDLDTWRKLIDLTSFPQKAFASPLSILEADHFDLIHVKGVVFDRYRLLSSNSGLGMGAAGVLRKKILKWLRPRVKRLKSEMCV